MRSITPRTFLKLLTVMCGPDQQHSKVAIESGVFKVGDRLVLVRDLTMCGDASGRRLHVSFYFEPLRRLGGERPVRRKPKKKEE